MYGPDDHFHLTINGLPFSFFYQRAREAAARALPPPSRVEPPSRRLTKSSSSSSEGIKTSSRGSGGKAASVAAATYAAGSEIRKENVSASRVVEGSDLPGETRGTDGGNSRGHRRPAPSHKRDSNTSAGVAAKTATLSEERNYQQLESDEETDDGSIRRQEVNTDGRQVLGQKLQGQLLSSTSNADARSRGRERKKFAFSCDEAQAPFPAASGATPGSAGAAYEMKRDVPSSKACATQTVKEGKANEEEKEKEEIGKRGGTSDTHGFALEPETKFFHREGGSAIIEVRPSGEGRGAIVENGRQTMKPTSPKELRAASSIPDTAANVAAQDRGAATSPSSSTSPSVRPSVDLIGRDWTHRREGSVLTTMGGAGWRRHRG